MRQKNAGRLALLALCAMLWPISPGYAQGVTTGSINGTVIDAQKQPIAGASVIAIHEPSGTSYEATTRPDGRFAIPGMRVGGPYTVMVTYAGGGTAFEPQAQQDVIINLGVATDLAISVRAISVQETVTVTAQSDTVFSSDRTGAATSVSRETIEALPSVNQRLESVVRLTPQASGMSIAGQDSRMNNITVDGSYFNNSFGLGNQPGDRTNVAPISMSAIEAVQVNVAPFDVRQGGFVGGGVNSITRSGTNQFAGSLSHQFRNEGLVGKEAKGLAVNPGTFDHRNSGGYLGGPVLRNKLFFFGNFEDEATVQPGTTFRANAGGEPAVGSTTRVLASDLNQLSTFLKSRFSYETGPYQDYDHETPGRRILTKFDYNLSNRNKVTFRYTQLNSDTDVLESDSNSLGFGNRRTRIDSLNFQNSNYQILENIKSGIGELNSILGNTMANSFIVGYTSNDESRASRGTVFPLVDILEGGATYTSFGFEPFTPNNELRYKTFQLQDNFTKYGERHSLTFGASFERYESQNVFFPGSQSAYVYNSLADFYADANDLAANPNRTTSPISLRIFQVRWNNIPGLEKPLQPLEVVYAGAYAQDEWAPMDNLKLTLGLRMDVPYFGKTGFANANADALTFRDETGAGVQYSTETLPDPNILWSPRVGFNWSLSEARGTQVRGGTGIFTGKPAYVWISNQIGNTGVLTGFERLDNTNLRPFNPDPNRYKPTTVTGAPASSYELALTDEKFKFPQLWRTNLAIDHRLPWNITATGEFLYNRDVNGIYYINANLPAAQSAFVGADNRPRWVGPSCSTPTVGGCVNRIHNAAGNQVQNAIVMKNQNVGTSWNLAGSAEKRYGAGFLKAAYSYGEARNTVDPGSIAFGSWNGNGHSGDPNNPGIGYANASPGHRVFVAATYRKEYFSFGSTGISMFWEARTIGNFSYTFNGDMNGDGGTSNDLLYIHRDTSEMNFAQFTAGGRTFNAAEQAQAWNTYIEQDEYLRKHRGEYAQRGAVFLPFVRRMDFSVTQDLFTSLVGKRHAFQFRVDVVNFGNLLNQKWGVGQRLISTQPLTNPGADAQGRATYRLRVINNELMTRSLEQTASLADVYRMLFSLRYTFN